MVFVCVIVSTLGQKYQPEMIKHEMKRWLMPRLFSLQVYFINVLNFVEKLRTEAHNLLILPKKSAVD